MRKRTVGAVSVLVLGGCGQGVEQGGPAPAASMPSAEVAPAQMVHRGLPALSRLASAWNTIHPGGQTTCLYGTEYGFFVRPADPSKVLITFPGGGACWSGLTCSDEPQGRVDDNPKTVKQEDNPAGAQGVFAEDNPENPFLHFTKVHVGYCTGDMHVGSAVRPNDGWVGEGARPSETLHFNGYRNAMTVLEWVFDNLSSPEVVVVGGYTSGSYGTPFYASYVADRYPQAVVRHIGDGNGALYIAEKLRPLIDAWGTVEVLGRQPGFEVLSTDGFTFEDVTIAAARRHPEIVFTQMITAHDAVFSELLGYLGVEEPILDVVEAGHRYVKSQVDNYRTYIAGGNKHVIGLGYFDSIPQSGNRNRGWPDVYDRFYSYAVDGRRYRDWVADMVEGVPIQDVRCSDCAEVQHYAGQ